MEFGSCGYISLENKVILQAIFHDMSLKELKMLHHEFTKQELVSRVIFLKTQ